MNLRASRWALVRPDGSCGSLWLVRATGFVDRLRGLIGRALPGPGQGLWIEPCRAVHSLAMRGPVDLVFVDRSRRVLAVRARLAPWRMAACPRAFSTIELRAGEAERLRIEPGVLLVESGAPLPVEHPFEIGTHPFHKEPVMAHRVENGKIERARRGRTRAAAAAAAVGLISGCAATDPALHDAVPREANAARSAEASAARSSDSADAAHRAADMALAGVASRAGPVRQADLASGNSFSGARSSAGSNSESRPESNSEPGSEANSESVSESVSQSAPEAREIQAGASASVSDASLHPVPEPAADIRTVPADTTPVQSARLAQAEILYRSSRFDEAMQAFKGIADADPSHAHAWLRIGNILHRKREWFDALSAYRKAARPQADAAIREKAVYNIALLNLELARQAMKRLERIRDEQGDSYRRNRDLREQRGTEHEADGATGSATVSPRSEGVSDDSLRRLSDQVALSYRALSAARNDSAPAPRPGPRTPPDPRTPSPAEQKVEVEIRQGGGGK